MLFLQVGVVYVQNHWVSLVSTTWLAIVRMCQCSVGPGTSSSSAKRTTTLETISIHL